MTLSRPLAVVLVLATALGGCSSSFGGGGGAPPAKTYIVLPNGQAVPADQYKGPTPGQ